MPRGTFTEEHRAKISQGQRQGFLQRADEYKLPAFKNCPHCGESKPIDHFRLRRRKLKSGIVRLYPNPWCNECMNTSTQDWKVKTLNRDGDEKPYSTKTSRSERLPAEPLCAFIEERVHRHGSSAVALAAGVDEALIRRYTARRDAEGQLLEWINLPTVDRILTNLGCPHCFYAMYGDVQLTTDL